MSFIKIKNPATRETLLEIMDDGKVISHKAMQKLTEDSKKKSKKLNEKLQKDKQ